MTLGECRPISSAARRRLSSYRRYAATRRRREVASAREIRTGCTSMRCAARLKPSSRPRTRRAASLANERYGIRHQEAAHARTRHERLQDAVRRPHHATLRRVGVRLVREGEDVVERDRGGGGAHASIFRSTFAGTPAATVRAGTSRVTTLLAPMTAPSPMVTPGRTTTLWPSHAPRPMVTGAIRSSG